jgi:ATP-dependent DNA helicase RecG
MSVPTNEEVLNLLDQLDVVVADDLESQWLDFKPWEGARESMRVAIEYAAPPYGTAQGLYKQRVGKNCMPMDPQAFAQAQVTTGAVDWSGQPAEGVSLEDLDPVEIARGRSIVKRFRPSCDLVRLNDKDFLRALGATRHGQVTRTGLETTLVY